MIGNISLLFLAIARMLVMTGIGPGLVFAIAYEKRGVLKFRAGQLAAALGNGSHRERRRHVEGTNRATSLARKGVA